MSRIHILIVEDDRTLAEKYKRGLVHNSEVMIVDRSLDVMIEIVRFRPHLIIMDIWLEVERQLDPSKAGIQILEKIRELPEPICNIPVIVITGYLEPEINEIRAECLELGVVKFFTKPIPLGTLREEVKKIMTAITTRVFISYSHDDRRVAHQLKYALRANGVEVIIDTEAMVAGTYIQRFIEQSILDTDVTLSVVSNNSLESTWVAMETIEAFHQKKYGGKRIIACFLNDDFFKPEYGLVLAKKIDERLGEISRLINDYEVMSLDAKHLNNEKTRLFHLRNHISEILENLRETLCIDIRDEKFDTGIRDLIEAIKSQR